MFRRKILGLIFCAVILGCTSTSRLASSSISKRTPPSASFLKKFENAKSAEIADLKIGSKEKHLGWWKTYRLGKLETDPSQACIYFKLLATEKDFPLAEVSLLRAHESCPQNEILPAVPEEISPWYQELWADVRLKEAKKNGEPTELIKALVMKARMENRRKNKEEYYLKALEISKKQPATIEPTTAEIEASLYKISPRLNPQSEFSDLNSVANDYRFHRDFNNAIKYYKNIFESKKSSVDEKFQALKNIRQTFKIARKRIEYIQATGELVNWTQREFQKNKKDRRSLNRYYDSQILFAKTLWTEDQTSRAVRVLKETQRKLKNSLSMDEVYFILGRIDEEKGRFVKALEYYQASTQEPPSQVGLQEKVLWMQAWNQYKLAKWQEATITLSKMRDQTKELSDKSRARFWLARSFTQLKKHDEAKVELEALAQEDSLGYYGVLAYRELGRPYPLISSNTTQIQSLSLLNVSEIPVKTRLEIEWLIAVQEKNSAEKLLQRAVADLKDQKQDAQEIWLNVASAYARTGLYLPLFAMISGLTPEVKDRLLADHPELLFPQAYIEDIEKATVRSGIPAEFILSIIRQESAFDPEARSPADAFGLMQLLPSVAKKIARREKLPYKKAQDLFNPSINIPLGAFELKALAARYDNQYILAVSGYNANAGAIRGWLKTRYRKDAIEFIEEVPYYETKSYIKLTMRNYVFYKRLRQPMVAFHFPEELLKFNSCPATVCKKRPE